MVDQNEKDLGAGGRTVAIDFDGVIHSYTSGWTGVEPLDPPVPGAGPAIRAYLDAGFKVVIYSTRAKTPEGLAAIKRYLGTQVGKRVADCEVTADKPIAILYIDDRGYQFKGTFPSPAEVAAFKPWKLGT